MAISVSAAPYVGTGDRQQPLNVLIAGAGIGGLTAAIALRQQGHNVTVLERARLAEEIGAAMHIAPNVSGLLMRMGIDPMSHGGVEMNGMTIFGATDGKVLSAGPGRALNRAMWQNPWMLMHRAHLHSALLQRATSEDGPGKPVMVRTRSKVADVDPRGATVTLADGEVLVADLVVGADGVHSATRKSLPVGAGGDVEPFDFGESAYRALVPMEQIAADETAKSLLEEYPQVFYLWMNKTARVVMYPCASNTQMNVAVLFPTSHSTEGEGEETNIWQRQASKQDMLDLCREFEPRVQAILNLVDGEKLKMWTLLDMKKLPSFVHERLVLLGDAAHPFLPYQAQGGAQAIEDGVSLGAVLPFGTTVADLPDHLRLYESQRYDRAHRVQEVTRLTGQDAKLNFQEFTAYNVGHDEWHASNAALQRHFAAKQALEDNVRWNECVPFGPITGPHAQVKDAESLSGDSEQIAPPSPSSTLSIETTTELRLSFKTSRTYLQTFLPARFRFLSPATICQASLVCTTYDGLSWLGGDGYHSVRLEIPGIEFTSPLAGEDAAKTMGTFIPVIFEDCAESIAAARDEAGLPKFFANIDVTRDVEGKTAAVKMSWRGRTFFEAEFAASAGNVDEEQKTEIASGPAPGAPSQAPGSAPPLPNKGFFAYRRCQRAPLSSNGDDKAALPAASMIFSPQSAPSLSSPESESHVSFATTSSFTFDKLDSRTLPTLHGVVRALAEIPNYGTVEARESGKEGGDGVWRWSALE